MSSIFWPISRTSPSGKAPIQPVELDLGFGLDQLFPSSSKPSEHRKNHRLGDSVENALSYQTKNPFDRWSTLEELIKALTRQDLGRKQFSIKILSTWVHDGSAKKNNARNTFTSIFFLPGNGHRVRGE